MMRQQAQTIIRKANIEIAHTTTIAPGPHRAVEVAAEVTSAGLLEEEMKIKEEENRAKVMKAVLAKDHLKSKRNDATLRRGRGRTRSRAMSALVPPPGSPSAASAEKSGGKVTDASGAFSDSSGFSGVVREGGSTSISKRQVAEGRHWTYAYNLC